MTLTLDPDSNPIAAGTTLTVRIDDPTANGVVTITSEAGTITLTLVLEDGKLVGSFVVPTALDMEIRNSSCGTIFRSISTENSAGA